jgi:hypothetical protein
LIFKGGKILFQAGGAMEDAMPFGNFSLIHSEEKHQPVL